MSDRLKVLLVDDEPLARTRLGTLLRDCVSPRARVVAEAGNAVQAMECLQRQALDVALIDIHMPGADGLALVRALRQQPSAPALIFVTAHAEHALQAFELEAVDYLTKPVRLERLQAALHKAQRYLQARGPALADSAEDEYVVIQERGRTERIALDEVVYFKAELKYITVRTAARSYILDASLNELEEKYASRFVRVHRNALAARRALRALQKHFDPDEGEGWALQLEGVDEVLAVSRRQLAALKELLAG